MLGGDLSVVVSEPEAVVAPYYGCAPCGATGGDAAAAFAVFLGVPPLRGEPIEGMGGGGEVAENELRGSLAGKAEGGCDLRSCGMLAMARRGLG